VMRPARFVGGLGNVLLGTLVVAAVILVALQLLAGSGRALPGGIRTLTVLSGSMEPAIPVGSVVVVGRVGSDRVRVGDVITFARGRAGENASNVYTTHRVVQVVGSGPGVSFVTRGDANAKADAAVVPGGQVVGRVMLTIPYLGQVSRFVRTPMGLVLLILLPAAVLITEEIWGLLRVKREAEEN
jgi:signal peptidase